MRILLVIFPLLFLIGCNPSINPTTNNQVVIEPNVTEAQQVNVSQAQASTNQGEIYLPQKDNLSIYVMDTSGQSVMVVQDGSGFLIDSGYENDSQTILKNIRNLGIVRLQNILISNPSDKTLGGMPYILIQATPAKIYESGIPLQSSSYKLYKQLLNQSTSKRVLLPTDTIEKFEKTFVRFIIPYDTGKGLHYLMDDNSIVTRFTYDSNTVLYTSNCKFECIESIKKEELSSDVLIIDGSCDSTTLSFIQKVNPKVVVSTKDYCLDTENRFNYLNIPYYSVSKHGDIRLSLDGLDFNLRYSKNE